MNRKGFANILILVIVIAAIVGGVGYVVLYKQIPSPTPSPTPDPIENPTPTPTPSPSPTPTPTPKPSPAPIPLPTTPKTGDIEEIQALLNKEQWVRVIVMLKGNEFTAPEFQDDAKKKAEVKKIQDAVLVTLTEKDFQI